MTSPLSNSDTTITGMLSFTSTGRQQRRYFNFYVVSRLTSRTGGSRVIQTSSWLKKCSKSQDSMVHRVLCTFKDLNLKTHAWPKQQFHSPFRTAFLVTRISLLLDASSYNLCSQWTICSSSWLQSFAVRETTFVSSCTDTFCHLPVSPFPSRSIPTLHALLSDVLMNNLCPSERINN